jgi:hypothetical protein
LKILKWCLAGLTGIAWLVAQAFIQSLNIGVITQFGFLGACLIFFAANIVLVAAVFLWPPDKNGKNRFDIERFPKLAKVLNDDGTRLGRFWAWLKRRGPAVLLPVAAVVLTPFFAAIIILALGFKGPKVWIYGTASTVIAVIWSMSLSAGFLDRLKAWVF